MTDTVTVALCSIIAEQKKQIDELAAYADRLADGLPDGMLPKDVENLRDANYAMAKQVRGYEGAMYAILEACKDTAMSDDVKFTYIQKLLFYALGENSK